MAPQAGPRAEQRQAEQQASVLVELWGWFVACPAWRVWVSPLGSQEPDALQPAALVSLPEAELRQRDRAMVWPPEALPLPAPPQVLPQALLQPPDLAD